MNDERSVGPERLRDLSVDARQTRKLRIRVSVSGGLETERVQLDADVTGDGHLAGRIQNPITGRSGAFDGQISHTGLRELIALVASDDFIDQPQEPALFPPDTAVGSLQITLAGEPIGTYLAAVDADQVAGTDSAAEPTSSLLAMILETAEAMVESGQGPGQTTSR